MKINNKIFNLPPYISTSWANIAALHVNETNLVVNLMNGDMITIPGLSSDLIELIFQMHAAFLEDNGKPTMVRGVPIKGFGPQGLGDMDLPFKIGIGTVDGLGGVMQHNPAQANFPPLPAEVLEKIQTIAKIIAPEDINMVPKAEPHCNCMHCQIARTINQGLGITDIYQKNEKEVIEEVVMDEELEFQQWEIKQLNDPKLYSVMNKLDPHETYNVFLGQPIGCTCGKQGCEHIVAVLKS